MGYSTNKQIAFPNVIMIHEASNMRQTYSPTLKHQLITVYEFRHRRMMIGAPMLCVRPPNDSNLVVLLWIQTYVIQYSTTSSNEDQLYLMPKPITQISSITSLPTWTKWPDWDMDRRNFYYVLKKKLLCSGIGTPLQWHNLFKDIPHSMTRLHTHQWNIYNPILNLYTLWCGTYIGGGNCRQHV